MSAPTYRERLRVEGLTLAAAGVAGSALLLATQEQAKRATQSTAIQLGMLAAGLTLLGPRSTAKALDNADRIWLRRIGDGEPTPLWHVPIPMIAGTIFVAKIVKPLNRKLGLPRRLARAAGWDAGLRVTAGAAMLGLYQALVIERQVARAEAARHRTYYRRPGSRLGSGTVLGWTR
jgi:hypothetical protein